MQKIFIALTLIVLSIPATALAAFGYQYPGYVTMTLNSAETELTIFWSSGAYSYDQNRGCLTDPNRAPLFRLSLDGNIIRQESLQECTDTTRFSGVCTYTFVLSYGGNNKISAGTSSRFRPDHIQWLPIKRIQNILGCGMHATAWQASDLSEQ